MMFLNNLTRRAFPALIAGLLALPAFAQAPKTQLQVYTTLLPESLAEFKSAFEAENPNIEIVWRRESTGTLTARIIAEAEHLAEEIEDKEVLDAGLIGSAQAVEHYEITRYGTLVAWAQQLGMKEAVKLLSETLEEEKRTDRLLTEMAQQRINRQAAE